MSTALPTVFISYRREDSAGHAGRLYDALAARFGDASVFMDVALAPGVDFVDRITTVVGGCRSLLVVIGPDWAAPAGRARLADPADFVRLEVETALARPDLAVIPLLVGGAQMPRPEQLPPSLRPLTRINALELSDLRWRYDVGRLEEALHPPAGGDGGGGDGGRPGGAAAPASPALAHGGGLLRLLAEGVAIATLAGMLGYTVADDVITHVKAVSDSEEIARTVARRAVTWTFVGGALAAWLAIRRGEPRTAPRRALLGMLLGAASGAVSGLIFALFAIVPERNIPLDEAKRVDIAAVGAVGLALGAALGFLWTPRRVAVGAVAGAAGAVVAQLVLNADTTIGETGSVGLRCVAIVGFALTALLALDVRAATRAPPVTAPAA